MCASVILGNVSFHRNIILIKYFKEKKDDTRLKTHSNFSKYTIAKMIIKYSNWYGNVTL